MPANIPSSFFEWVSFLLDKYGALFFKGTVVTLEVALTGTVFGFLLGLIVAIVRTIPLSKKSRAKRIALHVCRFLLGAYIEVFRGTPMIVQSMVIYYGLMQVGVKMPVLAAAIFIVSISDLRSSSPMLMLKSMRETAIMPKATGQNTASTELEAENEAIPALPTYFKIR